MTELNRPSEIGDDRLQEAAAWRVRLSEDGLVNPEAFEAWLSDPENANAWAQVQESWDFIGAIAGEPEVLAARHAALGDANRARVRTSQNHIWLMAARLAAVFLLVALGSWGALTWMQAPSRYVADIGERRVITLNDGSRLSLDSSSEVTVKFSRTARELRLVRGQARFDVAHDVERPFSVVAGGRKIIATGTAFNIDLAGGKVIVTLIQGHVVVVRAQEFPHPAQKRPIELEAGQQFVEGPGADGKVSRADLQRASAWTNGQLMVDNEPLTDVVEHMNRYTATPIVLADTRTGALRISGVFNATDTTGFIDTVTNYLPVQTETDAAGRIVLRLKK